MSEDDSNSDSDDEKEMDFISIAEIDGDESDSDESDNEGADPIVDTDIRIGPFVLPEIARTLSVLLRIDRLPFILQQDATIPPEYGAAELALLSATTWDYFPAEELKTEFHTFWRWCQTHAHEFMTTKNEIQVLNTHSIIKHLLTTRNGENFKKVKSVLMYNNAVPWQSCSVERLGSCVGTVLANGPRTGVGTLYDIATIQWNLPSYNNLDYKLIETYWLQNHRDALRGSKQVLQRHAEKQRSTNWNPLLNKNAKHLGLTSGTAETGETADEDQDPAHVAESGDNAASVQLLIGPWSPAEEGGLYYGCICFFFFLKNSQHALSNNDTDH